MGKAQTGKDTNGLQPGSLWQRVREQTEWAIARQSLLSIPTECEFIEQAGIRFIVRTVVNLVRKDENQQRSKTSRGENFNPFLPYEEDLFVADLSPTHLCLLNKFNVVDHHLLIVTRAFEEQEDWLNLQDFEAVGVALAEIEGLVFYNAGKAAGASQRHKHLQLVPLPFTPDGARVPIEPLFDAATVEQSVGAVSALPFCHAFTRWHDSLPNSPFDAAKALLERYDALVRAVGLMAQEKGQRQTAPYNLLVTREWMLLVPRSQPSFNAIAINSLGFAGALLVRNQEQMAILNECDPLTVLQNVALPRS
jgi:ATP adenylyltransferase